jgi:hypothetical protein
MKTVGDQGAFTCDKCPVTSRQQWAAHWHEDHTPGHSMSQSEDGDL